MRLILTTIILTMLAQPVSATTNDDLIGWCKPFSDNQFQIAGLTQDQETNAFLCVGFMMGVMTLASDICMLGDGWQRNLFGTSITKPYTMINRYLRLMEAEPSRRKDRVMPGVFVRDTCKE